VTTARCAQSTPTLRCETAHPATQKILKGVKLKTNSKDFRVPAGKKVDLHQWPTVVEPFFKSKEEYKTLNTSRNERQLTADAYSDVASNRGVPGVRGTRLGSGYGSVIDGGQGKTHGHDGSILTFPHVDPTHSYGFQVEDGARAAIRAATC
jgi:hypothetical protein